MLNPVVWLLLLPVIQLIALDKNPGVLPIGIAGETCRKIITKAILAIRMSLTQLVHSNFVLVLMVDVRLQFTVFIDCLLTLILKLLC